MFASFLIPSVFEDVRARHLCVFYAQLAALGREQVGFIGEPAYFEAPASLEAAGRPEWQESWRTTYGYDPPVDLAGVSHAALPADLLAPRLRRLGSSWKMYGQLVTRRLPELEAAFGLALQELDSQAPVEAILAFANNPSVSHVARQRGLPIVHNEFGPLRPPGYVMTGYWDRRGVSRASEATSRYSTFRRLSMAARVPLLDREEMLEVLRRTPSPAPGAEPPRYRVGVALQGEDNAYVHGIGALDLLSMARRHHRAIDVLVRYHPGSVARYSPTLAATDTSPSATSFITQCDTVLTVSSGTALEAMLLGRRAVVVGDSPLALAADTGLETRRRHSEVELLQRLNFLVFGYLVPGALMFDPAYVRWRLTEPGELDIFRHHQRWYRARMLEQPRPEQPAVALAAAVKLPDVTENDGRPAAHVVFGAGAATSGLVTRLRAARVALRGVFDNDSGKWGVEVAGVRIEPPRFCEHTSVVVASLTHADTIVNQLHTLGYPPERVLRLR